MKFAIWRQRKPGIIFGASPHWQHGVDGKQLFFKTRQAAEAAAAQLREDPEADQRVDFVVKEYT